MLRTIESLATLRDRPRRLLAVFAHPDDEAYGCAGVLARAGADDDTAVALLTLTNGEASTVLAAEIGSPEAVARVRTERMVAVAERLGLDALLMPGLPDSGLATVALERLGEAVGSVLDAFDPQVVIGPDPRGVNAHPDHIAAHWAVRRGLEGRPARRFAQLVYLQDTADAVKPRLLFPVPEEQVDVTVTLSPEEIDAKEDCLRIHEALVTVKADSHGDLIVRPGVELFDLFGEAFAPPVTDVFEALPEHHVA